MHLLPLAHINKQHQHKNLSKSIYTEILLKTPLTLSVRTGLLSVISHYMSNLNHTERADSCPTNQKSAGAVLTLNLIYFVLFWNACIPHKPFQCVYLTSQPYTKVKVLLFISMKENICHCDDEFKNFFFHHFPSYLHNFGQSSVLPTYCRHISSSS